MNLTEEQQQSFLISELESWARDLYDLLREEIRSRQKHIPEETLQNLAYQVINLRGIQSEFLLSLQDSGRIVEMRNIKRDGNPITREENFIRDWARRQGRSAFKRVPGYNRKSNSSLSPEEEVDRIASSIIFAKGSQSNESRNRRRQNQLRRKTWRYNKTVYGMIDRLISNLLRNQAEFFSKNIKKDMEENVQIDL